MSVANRHDSVEIEWPPTLSSYEQVQSELREAIETHPPFGDWLMQHCNARTVCGYDSGGEKCLHMSVPQLKEEYSKHAKQQALRAATTHAMAEEHLLVLRNSPGYKEACKEKLRLEEAYKVAMELFTNECSKIDTAAAGGYKAFKMPKRPEPPVWEDQHQRHRRLCRDALFESHQTLPETIIMKEVALEAVISKMTQAETLS